MELAFLFLPGLFKKDSGCSRNWRTSLGDGLKYLFFYFYLGKIPILTNIFHMGEESQQTRRCWSSKRNPAKLPQGATLMAIGVLWNWPKLLLLSCVELHGKPRGKRFGVVKLGVVGFVLLVIFLRIAPGDSSPWSQPPFGRICLGHFFFLHLSKHEV